jgi:hypothetical protein
MGTNLDLVDAWHASVYANPPATVKEANDKYLSDNFNALDAQGNVLMNKDAYTGMSQLLFTAFPDYKAVFSEKREEEDGSVVMSFHFEGTHTSDLDLSAMGLGVIPASGKKLVWPESTSRWYIVGDKIVKIQSIRGGMEDFLAPLGVKIPAHK